MYPVKTYNCRCKVVAYFPNHSKDRGTGKSVQSYNKWLLQHEKAPTYMSNLELKSMYGNISSNKNDTSWVVRNANPNYDKSLAYQTNCQRCMDAVELRSRGYNVEAIGKLETNNKVKWGSEIFVDDKDNDVYFEINKTKQDLLSELKSAPDKSRYGIYFQWIDDSGNVFGHVMNAQKIDGEIHFIDGQISELDSSYELDVGIEGRFGYLRLDDKKIKNDRYLLMNAVKKGQ